MEIGDVGWVGGIRAASLEVLVPVGSRGGVVFALVITTEGKQGRLMYEMAPEAVGCLIGDLERILAERAEGAAVSRAGGGGRCSAYTGVGGIAHLSGGPSRSGSKGPAVLGGLDDRWYWVPARLRRLAWGCGSAILAATRRWSGR
jgi:hypothetical protein